MQLTIALPLIPARGKGRITALLRDSAAISLSVGTVELVDSSTNEPTDVIKMRNPVIPYLDKTSGVYCTRNSKGELVPYPHKVHGSPSDLQTGMTMVVTDDATEPVKMMKTWVRGAGVHTQVLASCIRDGDYTVTKNGKDKTYRHYKVTIDPSLVKLGSIRFTCFNDNGRTVRGTIVISQHKTSGMDKFIVS